MFLPAKAPERAPLTGCVAQLFLKTGMRAIRCAREAYGVVLAGDGVDEAATAALRTARAHERVTEPFDFGAARREHERRWPDDLQDLFIHLLMGLPAPYRSYARRTLHGRIAALADQRAVTAEDVTRLVEELRDSLRLG